MLRWTLRDFTLIRPHSKASLVTRGGNSDCGERFVLHLQHRGKGIFRQEGREAELDAGGFCLGTIAHPYQIEISDHEFLVVEFPRERLDSRIANLEDYIAKKIPGSTAGSRLLRSFFLSLWQIGDLSSHDPDWQDSVAEILLDLITVAIKNMGSSEQESHSLLERTLRFVNANICDPSLNSVVVSQEMGVSARTVQNIFAGLGTTPAAYIMHQRLVRASEMLVINPAMTITEIALELGFNESNHFARRFRHQFGATPSQWRTSYRC